LYTAQAIGNYVYSCTGVLLYKAQAIKILIIILIVYKKCNLQTWITHVIFNPIFTNQQIKTVPCA